MHISSAEVIPYALPFKEPYVTAAGTLTRREMAILRLRSVEGLVGLGEAVPLSLRGGASLRQVVRELEELAESGVLERATEGAEAPGESLQRARDISAPARCAALTALLDLLERWEAAGCGTPPGSRIAAPHVRHDRGPVPVNATLVSGETSAVAEDALRWAADGFSTFKLKVGSGEDVMKVKAVREALGPEAGIRLDANGAWTLEEARRLLPELEPLGIEFVEQPVATMEEAAELARSSGIPLAGDESICTPDDAVRARDMGAYRLAAVKLSKVGGIEPGMKIASALPAVVSSALDGPVGIAAAARLAQMLQGEGPPRRPRLAQGLATQRLFASTIASVECEVREGLLHPPEGPGLGVEIDEEALQAHRL